MYEHYRKEMASKMTIHARSALPHNQKKKHPYPRGDKNTQKLQPISPLGNQGATFRRTITEDAFFRI